MKINSLSLIRGEGITCFLSALENYFVKFPRDVEYWKSRLVTACVDWELFLGMFDGENPVGFIINGIDPHNEKFTAYNTGTGILPEYRGKSIVDQLYLHSIPLLKNHGIEKSLLELICENERTIKVYKRIGFRITRTLKNFQRKSSRNEFGENSSKMAFFRSIKE